MNFLNQIITILLSENRIIIFVLSFIFTFIEAYLTFLIFSLILNIYSNNKKKLFYIFSLSILSILIKILLPTPYNVVFNIIISPVLVFFIFKSTILKSILSQIIPFLVFGIVGSILINILDLMIPNISKNLYSIPLYKLIYSISLYLIIYLICMIIKLYKLKLKIIDKFNNNYFNKILILNLVIGIIAIFIESYMFSKYHKILSLSLSLISMFVLLLYFIVSIYSLIRTSKLEIIKQNLEQSKLYNKTLKTLYDNVSIFKHDFNNIFQSIGGYIELKDLDGLKKYYKDIFNDCQKINSLSLLNPEIINNPAIYNLVSSKYYLANSLGIKMNLNIFIDLNNINMKIYDLTKVLGILLDNCIEETKNCNKKFIEIEINTDNSNKFQIIIIRNSCRSNDINLNKIFQKHYTTKSNKESGLGLWEVNKILKKYNNIFLYTNFENNIFEQKLELEI